ncbi:MAG: peptidylprolyl isomerase [Cytophagales bacterium]|nr:MAG: peptidylprolyl isomerase [Cytophagales bacterium]
MILFFKRYFFTLKPLFFGLLFIVPFLSSAQLVDKIIAKVDNQIVLKSELELTFLQFMASAQGQNPEMVKCKVLESLVMNKLLAAKAEIDSVTVDREQVERELTDRMNYFIQSIGSERKLEEYYGKTIDQLKADLKKQVKEQLLIKKMQRSIVDKVKVTPAEVKKYFNAIPKDSLPYFSTEVEIGQILKAPIPTKQDKLEVRQKLEELKAKIQAGEDFCALATRYSEDPGSAANCGELGFFPKGSLVPEYEGVAYKLKPGELSSIIETEYGFHLIQLIERRANEVNTRHILIKPGAKSVDLVASIRCLDSLRNKIIGDSISFEKAAKDNSDDKATKSNGGYFQDPKNGTNKMSLENIDAGLFFMIDTMTVGNISQPIPIILEDGTKAMRIIYFKSKTPPHQANLKDDYQKIYQAAMKERENRLLDDWFNKTKAEVFIDIDSEYKSCQILKVPN